MGSARQGSSAAKFRKNADTVEALPVDSCCGYFASEYSNKGSDNGQSDKSRSFTEKGNGMQTRARMGNQPMSNIPSRPIALVGHISHLLPGPR